MKVDRPAGIAGPQVVDVHAVGRAAGRGEARRHQGLGGDVSAGDVVARVVQLSGAEVVVVDAIDVERGDDVGQRWPAVTHSGNPFTAGEQVDARQVKRIGARRGRGRALVCFDRPP